MSMWAPFWALARGKASVLESVASLWNIFGGKEEAQSRLEAHVEERFKYHIEQENPFGDLSALTAQIDTALQASGERIRELQDARATILTDDEVRREADLVYDVVEIEAGSALAFEMPDMSAFDGFETRLNTSVLSGGVGAAVAATVIKKGLLKQAASALGEKVAGKLVTSALGAAGGAAVGGALGSVVPGAGTTTGVAAGAAWGGVIFGVGMDALLIEVDEALNREDFRVKIVSVILEKRDETRDNIESIGGETSDAP